MFPGQEFAQAHGYELITHRPTRTEATYKKWFFNRVIYLDVKANNTAKLSCYYGELEITTTLFSLTEKIFLVLEQQIKHVIVSLE